MIRLRHAPGRGHYALVRVSGRLRHITGYHQTARPRGPTPGQPRAPPPRLKVNGLAGTDAHTGNRGVAHRFTTLGGDPAVRWMAAVDSIPAWSRRMRGVKIEQDCGISLCEKIEDREGTVIYADPPYLAKGASYLHDFASADHQRLAVALRRFTETRVVVSYYEHPRLADLYPGWTKVACAVAKSMVNKGRRDKNGRTEAPEVLLINGPALGTHEGLFA